jgi:CDP-diacylglycerol--serine O-phosphatidyltransferase
MKRVYCYVLPSIFTAGNLLCGFIAIVCLMKQQFSSSAWFILFAMIFDIMDGRIARLTKGISNFGAEFDSLADLVSFGAAPAALAFFTFFNTEKFFYLGIFACFVYLLCGALRLARYNVAPSSDNFTGMPIPGGAALIATVVLFNGMPQGADLGSDVYFLLMFIIFTAVMMISTVPYPSLKKNKIKAGAFSNFLKSLFTVLIIGGCIVSPEKFLFLMAVSYSVSGPAFSLVLFIRHILENDIVDLDEETDEN